MQKIECPKCNTLLAHNFKGALEFENLEGLVITGDCLITIPCSKCKYKVYLDLANKQVEVTGREVEKEDKKDESNEPEKSNTQPTGNSESNGNTDDPEKSKDNGESTGSDNGGNQTTKDESGGEGKDESTNSQNDRKFTAVR